MKIWQCDDARPLPGLISGSADLPRPAPGELLVRVHAAGVTRTELEWYSTIHQKSGEDRLHAIPGHEFSGVVAEVGEGVTLAIGQEIFGMNDWFADGATAEFCCTTPGAIAPKPVRLTHVEAASIPIGALTAWQGLFDHAQLQSGERVLIHGGSGGVGVLAVQLARLRGAHVLTTASLRSRETLLQLGAERVIDHRSERFEEIVGEVDVVFDAVGGSTLRRSWQLLGPRGRLVTVAASSSDAEDERTKQAFFIVEPNRQQLLEIGEQIDSGRLQPVLDTIVPLDSAGEAYLGPGKQSRGFGKTVISLR